MKIISKFKDYYDNMRCYANPNYCSDDFTYIRKPQTTPIPTMGLRIDFHLVNRPYAIFKHAINRRVIGFCGLWYFVYSIKTRNNYYNPQNEYLNYDFFVNAEAALSYAMDMKYIKKQYNKNNFEWGSDFKKYRMPTLPQTIIKVMEHWETQEAKRLKELQININKFNLFEQYNTPVIELVEGPNYKQDLLLLNPNLKKLQFYKMIEGNIAYQEIEMFLGNELLPKDDATQITDSLILASNHGFNKLSFRKAPSKAEKRAKRKEHKKQKRNNIKRNP